MLTSFILCLAAFVAIGLASLRVRRPGTADYLSASRSVPPWLVALSAVATNNSGYMFTGMIGFTFVHGLSSIWLMVGWLVGDLIGSLRLWRAVRVAAARGDAHSFSTLLAHGWGQDHPRLRRASAVLIVLFLGSYAAAQLNAGGKALHVLLGWELGAGALLAALIVFAYSLAGGLRASIWTDAAQSFVMLFAMGLLVWRGLAATGGPEAAWTAWSALDPAFLRPFGERKALEAALFVLGWIAAGFGVVGQPHIMIRHMTLDDPRRVQRVRLYYYGWFAAFYALTIGAGMLARLFVEPGAELDSELALPLLASEILSPFWVGIILAGLFAATLSTADSLVLACSAALSQDLRREAADLRGTKRYTAAVVMLALLIAWYGDKSVFELVLLSWGLLAAAFAPLLLVYTAGRRLREGDALLLLGAGVGAYLAAHYGPLTEHVYPLLPALLAVGLLWAVYLRRRSLPAAA